MMNLSRQMIVAVAKDALSKSGSNNIDDAYTAERGALYNQYERDLQRVNAQTLNARLLLQGLRLPSESEGAQMARAIVRSLLDEYEISSDEYRSREPIGDM